MRIYLDYIKPVYDLLFRGGLTGFDPIPVDDLSRDITHREDGD